MIETEARIKNLTYFQEAYYNWFCQDDVFGEDEWDDLLAEKKCREFQFNYNIPYNVIYNSEFHPDKRITEILSLAKKWVLQKASLAETYKLIYFIDWYHELDLSYILWGFPNNSLSDAKTYDLCFIAPFYIRPHVKITATQVKDAMLKVYKDYYGEKAEHEQIFKYLVNQPGHEFILEAFSSNS